MDRGYAARVIDQPESPVMPLFRKLLSDSTGAAAVEMGLVLALVVIAILGTVIGLGEGVTGSYNDTAQKVAEATPKSPGA